MVLLTGANGHLGANLLRRLLADGAAVRVLLRPGSDNSTVDGLAAERVSGDLRDPASLAAAVEGCEGIYHCAAEIATISGGEQEIFANNVIGTRNLLRAAREHGVRKVVVTGSLSAVGHLPDRPSDESVPFNPFERHLPYAHSKAAVEHECLKAAADGLDVVIAVSCAIIGPHDFKPSRMGQVLIDYANGRLHAYCPGGFTFVAARDIVEGHVLCMNQGRTGHKYIFATEYLTLDALFDVFSDVTGQPKPALRMPPGVMTGLAGMAALAYRFMPGRRQLLTPAAIHLLRLGRRADCGKAEREFGYRPGSIAEAVREAYDWFVARGAITRPSTASTAEWARGRG